MPKAATKPPPLVAKPFLWSCRNAFDDTWPTLPTFAVMTSPRETLIEVFSTESKSRLVFGELQSRGVGRSAWSTVEPLFERVRVESVSSGSEALQA